MTLSLYCPFPFNECKGWSYKLVQPSVSRGAYFMRLLLLAVRVSSLLSTINCQELIRVLCFVSAAFLVWILALLLPFYDTVSHDLVQGCLSAGV